MNERHEEFDVGIVGLGPVGATAAILLANEGLRVVAFERGTEVYPLPRAVGIDGEIVRAFQRIGLDRAVDALLQPHRDGDMAAFTNSKREILFGLRIEETGLNGWRDISFFDQPELEQFLRDTAAAMPGIDLRLGTEVTALAQDGKGVRVTATHLASERESRTRARYLIGCDGASSFVRKAIGARWESLGYDQDWLVIDIKQKPSAHLPLETMQVCDPNRLTTYVCTKDPYRRWEFRLNPGETREEMVHPEKIRELLASWIAPEDYELRRAVVYQFHAATADRWQAERIFLAGDAAHQTPPFLGQGMNAGLRDVVNLSWKLKMVLDGQAEEALLATYTQERDSHARDLVQWAVAVGQLMETLAAAEAGQAPPPPPDAVASGYGQGRLAPPLTGGVLRDEQVSAAGFTGYLFRQPLVKPSRGNACFLDQLLGPGFAVVARSAADLDVSPESQRILDRLGARAVALDGIRLVRGKIDGLFEHHKAVVVRPDRYIYGVTTETLGLDALVQSLPGKLSLKP
jgi:3-(3-hydroxy-phenyl)propionate hydroxylase